MNERGVSLIESLLMVVVIGMIVILLSNIPSALSLMSKSNHLGLVREIATKQIEDKRALGFVNLVNDTSTIEDSRMSMLPFGSGTIVVADCPSQICTNGEPIKQITISINWEDNNKMQNTTIKTFIGDGGIK